MKICLFFVLVMCLCAELSFGQFTHFQVQLKDKEGTSFSLSKPSEYLSIKAINRRIKQNIAIDSTDLPLNASYVDSIIGSGNVHLHNTSKWFNTICIETIDSQVLEKIRTFSFVRSITPLAGFNDHTFSKSVNKQTGITSNIALPDPTSVHITGINGEAGFDYGNSLGQIHLHNGEYLHDMGLRGEGMTIAVLDAGFYQYKTNPVFDSLRLQHQILGEYDFVNGELSVNEDNDHGAHCLSILAANKPGAMVGSAPKADYYLLKTEDTNSETPLEEQNWASAAEYADSAGVDLISSSLGYINFDNPIFNHSYAQRDGNTALITKAADMAAKKGILVMNSVGNDGSKTTDNKFVTCPADGDSVLAVGAVDISGVIAPLSSWGPNAAGVIKPDVVSLGTKTAIALPNGTISSGGGTSFSNPNLAGLVACLWQAFPEFNNMAIIEAVKKSANRYSSPDERYGYGIPDMKKAYNLLLGQRVTAEAKKILGNNHVKVYPVPFKNQVHVVFKAASSGNISLSLMDISGKLIASKVVNALEDSYSIEIFSHLEILSKGIYVIQFISKDYKISLKLVK